MNIIMGASGHVGSGIIDRLITDHKPVKAVLHHAEKADQLKKQGAEIAFADAFDLPSLITAFQGGDTLFVITPENGQNLDLIAETKIMLANYRSAVESCGITKVVGLSSLGAHLGAGTGNLEMSYLLERAFDGLPLKQVFIRAAYFFSNWLMGMEQVKATGELYSFFPENLSLPMVSPCDISEIAANLMLIEVQEKVIYEVEGQHEYTPGEVAQALSFAMGKTIKVHEIPKKNWHAALHQVGFSDNSADNFIKMTEQTILSRTNAEGGDAIKLKGHSTLQQFITDSLKSKEG